MIKTEKQGLKQLFYIALPLLVFSTLYTLLIFTFEEAFGDHIYKVSGQIGSVFGLAVAFFLGFRMNSAYDRWWEARKVFGELTNNTRSFVAKIYVYYSHLQHFDNLSEPELKLQATELIDLCTMYIRQLKNEIHHTSEYIFNEETNVLFAKFRIIEANKVSNEILLALAKTIEHSFSSKSNIEKSDLMQHINRFYEIQGKAERIKNTPFLMIYSAFTKMIVSFYVVLIPLFIGDIDLGGEESIFEFIAIPIMLIISTAFLTINKLANLYGEPFSDNKTSINTDSICLTIEQNCKQVLFKLLSQKNG